MITLPPKRGMALVMVLLLLAVMASVSVGLSQRISRQTDRMRSLQDYQQATWYAVSAESLALSILNENLKNEEHTPIYSWSIGSHLFPLSQGKMTVTLRDAQACFNLNALAQPAKVSGEGEGQLITLISRLDVPARRAAQITESLQAFIGGGRDGQKQKDSEYLSRPVPFWPAKQPLTDISELRVVQGMDAALYQKIKPLVCVLPMNRQRININSLDVSQSVILEALFGPGLSPAQARALLQQRPGKGWRNVGQFLASPYLKRVDENVRKQAGEFLTVNSRYFWLRSDITVNETELTMNSLIARTGPQHFSVLWHQTGESE
ncbi:general secretion pathway protein GspK [Escherichia coli]|uniref:type II secretion system minor pseudopilin GspK n=1 Tax=Escherichia coli TaxID=562 RepID=UPI00107D0809|nr:type II secretion system minor pseudopilin GspK [Escherichia coli]EAA4912558.1 general secretion pathway protein GspK [Escherichia coli]EFC7008021.1 type II secretion system minor pseudopilin GspK [Escherichia coli]EFK4380094.1 type II secretion system minor pseudopilin GspK [Escherichia coli]EJU2088763.1 type II secretion system minor pseudopilin GspK [Escherichia coli]EKK7769943.1 type II secretion system minor pseudopilin GspK [Escherichia coli]